MNYVVRRKPRTNLFTWGLDSLLDDFFADTSVLYTGSGTNYPKVDVREEEASFVIEAELPGLTEKDIDVKVEDNLITISSKKSDVAAKKDDGVKEKKNGYIIRERRSSAFSRAFTLPDNVDKENIGAHYTNGLLTLSIPKTKEATPKEIEIKTK
jgi:HSP20 family protein